MPEITEEILAEYLDFIRGAGKFSVFDKGIHTHPGFDKSQDDIHVICEELERRGLVVKKIDELGHAYFE